VSKFQKFPKLATESNPKPKDLEFLSNIDKEINDAKATTAASLNSKPISFSYKNSSKNDETSSFMNPMYGFSEDQQNLERTYNERKESSSRENLFESEIEFIGYLDQFKPARLGTLSSNQIINYHRFMEVKIKKALIPVYYNKF
jgi:oligoribonuclease (3'-5' exoribonuclease)